MTNTPPQDSARPIREGETLDLTTLDACLRDNIPNLDGPLTIEQFPSGHSNLTYLLRFGDRELVLRRPPFGAKVKSGHDMGREHRILSGLTKVYNNVPRPLFYTEDEEILGAPFYIMERLQGVILRGMKPIPGMDPAQMRLTCEALVDELVAIHNVDLKAAGLEDLGKPEGYISRQISGWTRRYQKSQTDKIPDMDQVAQWLDENQPKEVGATLIHNDFKYDNVIWNPNDLSQITGVLDWEMATLGDPLMDLGTTLGYWVEHDDLKKLGVLPFGPTALPGNLNRREVVERYAEKSGRDISNALFYYAYALFKISVILQQIYARYKHGHTTDPRFANFIFGVHLLSQTASTAINAGRIERIWDTP